VLISLSNNVYICTVYITKYEIKKVVVCDHCYNKIDLHLEFDNRYKIINEEITEGKIITKEKFKNN
jgi:hypothetical protein